MNIEPQWNILPEGVLLRPGDEVLREGVWLPFKSEWGWRVPVPNSYRRRVYQQVNVPWLDRKIEEVRSKLKSDISREKFAYQVESIWSSLANNMQVILEKYTEVSDVERVAFDRVNEHRKTDLESTQTA